MSSTSNVLDHHHHEANKFPFISEEIVKVFTSRNDYDQGFPFMTCRVSNWFQSQQFIPLFFYNHNRSHIESLMFENRQKEPLLLYLRNCRFHSSSLTENNLLYVERCHDTLKLTACHEEDFIGKSFCCRDMESHSFSTGGLSSGNLSDLFLHPLFSDLNPSHIKTVTCHSSIEVFHSCYNPFARVRSNKVILTGISSIDLFSTFYVGQHACISTAKQLSHASLVMKICEQAKIYSPPTTRASDDSHGEIGSKNFQHENENFFDSTPNQELIVVCCMQTFFPSDCQKFKTFFANSLSHRSVYLCNCHTCKNSTYLHHRNNDIPSNTPNSTSLIWTKSTLHDMNDALPFIAMSICEFLAFHCGRNVLLVWYGMEPFFSLYDFYHVGSLRTKCSTLFEKCGMMKGKKGSISALSVIENPNDDHTHKFIDILNGLADCTIALDRYLKMKQIDPPIAVEFCRFRYPSVPSSSETHDEMNYCWNPLNSIRPEVDVVRNIFIKLLNHAKNIYETHVSLSGMVQFTAEEEMLMNFLRGFELKFLSQQDSKKEEDKDDDDHDSNHPCDRACRHFCETMNLACKLLMEFLPLEYLRVIGPIGTIDCCRCWEERWVNVDRFSKMVNVDKREWLFRFLLSKCKDKFIDVKIVVGMSFP